jgi:hypothetical protein
VAGNITSFTNNVSTDPFGDLRVSQKHSVIDIKSIFSLSSLRDLATTVGTGAVTCPLGGPEFHLQTSAANDKAGLTSQQRGVYVAGFGAEIGIACRIPSSMTGSQVARWGYFDNSASANGFYFMYTASGMNIVTCRNGTETVTPQASWNVDKMDGTGPSGVTLDMTRGNIFQQVFSWYGFGAVAFRIVATDAVGNQIVQVVHRWAPNGQTSVANANLNINVTLQNGATATSANVYIAGRQFSTLGNPSQKTNDRLTSIYNVGTGAAASVGTGAFVPILSFMRKTGYLGVPIVVSSLDILTSNDIIYQLRVNPTTLTGTSWVSVVDTMSSETALMQDTAATAIAGGIVIYTGLVAGGSKASGSGSNNFEITYVIEESQTVTLCTKSLTAGRTSVNAVCRIAEQW